MYRCNDKSLKNCNYITLLKYWLEEENFVDKKVSRRTYYYQYLFYTYNFLYEIQFQIIILYILIIINVIIFSNWSNLELKVNFHSMLSKINIKIKTRNVEKIYIKWTYPASNTEFRKGGTVGKLDRHRGGEPVSCFDAIHEHRVA